MKNPETDALRLVPIETVKAWKAKAENRFMTSSLGEYCPEEFLTLADAYIVLSAAPASPLPGTVIAPGQVSYDPEQGFVVNGWRVEIGDQGPKAGLLAIINFLREEVEKTPEEEISEAYFSQSSASPLPGGGDMDWQDKAEGLESDLRQAVLVAWKRGAEEWCRLNYPQWVDWLEACHAPAAPTGEPK